MSKSQQDNGFPGNPSQNMQKISSETSHLGLALLSSAVLDDVEGLDLHESVRDEIDTLKYAVVVGMRLSGPVLRTVKTAPTLTYYYHYKTINFALDQAALYIAGICQRMGGRVFPVPASQILDWDRFKAHLSHREIACRAGMGWKGRNNLIVNPEYGSQVRYVTVLTDLPLPDGSEGVEPMDCGSCKRCISACPVGAIHVDPDDFELDRCTAQLRRFAKDEQLNTLICGLCVKVCEGSGALQNRETKGEQPA
ncbi:MAG: 4Fe-4S binding protein [Bacteroidales bacterium]|nr:4Fe-4S binding protein [Candidatus Latescibacterota bacterium]